MTRRIALPADRAAAPATVLPAAAASLPWPAPRPTRAWNQACREAVADDGRIRVGAAFRIAAATR